jgi:hypothetical protein
MTIASKVLMLLAYFRLLARRQRAMYEAGALVGLPSWRILLHGLGRLRPAEFWAAAVIHQSYANGSASPFGEFASREWTEIKEGHERSELARHHRHGHNWQHWLYVDDDGGRLAYEMPDWATREMVADWWAGAKGMAGEGTPDLWMWYYERAGRLVLHRNTRVLTEALVRLFPSPSRPSSVGGRMLPLGDLFDLLRPERHAVAGLVPGNTLDAR